MRKIIHALILPILAFFASAVVSIPLTMPAYAANACLSAPASMFTLGDTVVVAPGVDRLNMRFLPAVGTGIAAPLYHGNRLTVIGGPSCNGMYTWWRVETSIGKIGWVAEGTWSVYYLLPAEMPSDLPAEYAPDHPPTPYEWTCELHFDSLRCP